jgi:hypothetical protein
VETNALYKAVFELRARIRRMTGKKLADLQNVACYQLQPTYDESARE